MRRAGERNVAFAGEQARGRIEADPAGAGHIDLGPGVQVGEVGRRAGGTVERLLVGGELYQIARDKARRQAEVAQDLYQQPAGVAAAAQPLLQRLFAGLHAGLEADRVVDVLLEFLVDLDQEVRDAARLALDAGEVLAQQLAGRLLLQIRRQFLGQCFRIGERPFGRVVLDEEVEGVDDRQVGDHLDVDQKFRGLLGKDQPREVVAERVLLPVDEVLFRLDLEAVGLDRRAAVGGGLQPHDVRAQGNRTVEAVIGGMAQGDVDGHAGLGTWLTDSTQQVPCLAYSQSKWGSLSSASNRPWLHFSLTSRAKGSSSRKIMRRPPSRASRL